MMNPVITNAVPGYLPPLFSLGEHAMPALPEPAASVTPRQLMRQPSTYEDGTTAVHEIETHISRVYLTDRFAYKLKKRVKFEFLDFSTVERRRRACEDEVRLNSPRAPGVYLGVVPITRDASGRLALNGGGKAIDWVVKMQRLPAERRVDELISGRRLSREETEQIARHLADLYSRAAPETLEPAQYVRQLNEHLRANRDDLLAFDDAAAERIRRVHDAQLRALSLGSDVFESRVCDGRIVHGHGDLRPDHIYLRGRPLIVDCVEFSRELRTLDVLDELAFLALECEQLGDDTLGERAIAAYCQEAGDRPPRWLIGFYKSYRACVRAKISSLRAAQVNGQQRKQLLTAADSYLELAARHAERLGPPLVIVMTGLMGSGKSTLSLQLADQLSAARLSTDEIRQKQLGASEEPAAYGQGKYSPKLRKRVYDEMIDAARRRLEEGESVVLDGAFLTDEMRQRALQLAERDAACPLLVHCDCPPGVARGRIMRRAEAEESPSEARVELYESQQREFEPPGAGLPALTIDTTQPMNQTCQSVCRHLTEPLLQE